MSGASGLKFVQGKFICAQCGQPIRFYIGYDSSGPKACSEHQAAHAMVR